MLEIIQESQKVIEISNEQIIFKFYKTGHLRGYYEVIFLDKIALKNCFCNIMIHNEDFGELTEFKSTQTSYTSTIEKGITEFGMGLNIFLTSLKTDKLDIVFNIQIQLFEDKDFFLIKLLDIEDKTSLKRRIHSISPMTLKDDKLWLNGLKKATNLEKITWFKNGFQSWSPCSLLYGTDRDIMGPSIEIFNLTLDNQDYHIQGRFYSEYCTVITDLNSNNSLILGFVTNKDQFTRIIIDYENPVDVKLLTAFGCMDGVTFHDSNINSSETLFIGFKSKNQGYNGLIDYAKLVKSTIDKSIIAKIPVGWCSWYYYFTDITESDMIKNLDFFIKNKDIPIDFIQLDDGYFTKVGDYLNINQEKFPNKLDYLFSQIKRKGFKSGIWTAPFLAVRTSDLFKTHRDWFITRNHKPLKVHFNWNSFEYGLDLTRDEVLNYIHELFNRLYHINKTFTMDFFKIDFLHSAVPYNASYSKKNFTRAQILHRGVKQIRETITPQSFLLGCGAPLGPCIGLVNAMRISGDTAPIWNAGFIEQNLENKGIEDISLKSALKNILYRSFMHNYFWINDPDCLMIRRNNTELTLEEIRLQITIFGLSGGQLLISDDMTILSKDEIDDAKLLIPPYNSDDFDPIVIDAFQNPIPTIYKLETKELIGHRFLTTIINWNDDYESKSIKISKLVGEKPEIDKKYLVFSFWDKKSLGIFNFESNLNLSELAPHSCAYLSIIPINKDFQKEIIIISSDLHISQGCYEIKNFEYIEEDTKISLKINVPGKRNGNVYLKLPLNKKVIEYENNCEKIDDAHNIWKFHVEVENEKIVEINVS